MGEQQNPTEHQQHTLVGGDGGDLNPRELVSYYSKVTLHQQVKQKLRGSGFEFMFEIKWKISNFKSLLAALINNYNVSLGAFLIGQNKLYFGLEDVLMITGLRIDGKPVIFYGNTPNLTKEQVFELVGVYPKEQFVSTNDLVNFINSLNDENANEDRVNCTARATTLLGIACMISSDIGKSRIPKKFINFLMDVGEINTYAWGAASWVKLHTTLKAFRVNKKQMHTNLCGCVFVLEIFFQIHIPKLVRVCLNKIDGLTRLISFPLFEPCVTAMGKAVFFDGKCRPSVKEIEKIVLELDSKEVVWKPYKDLVLDDPYLQQGVLRRS
ncbi:hypothetical protein K1719_011918 [Acacia pycnantha]|nr:hypothetical protein K1719_011918 [Acacia pycnantha]